MPSSSEPERILKAIRAVTSGEIAAAPWLAAVLNQESGRSRRPRPAGDQPVTARELEVISLVAEGLSNKEVARRLGIREQTVKNHLVQISKKLGVSSRLEIGLEAVRHHVAVRRRFLKGRGTPPPAEQTRGEDHDCGNGRHGEHRRGDQRAAA